MFKYEVNSTAALLMHREMLDIHGLNEESNAFQIENKNNVEEMK